MKIDFLFERVDNSPLILFRILFGFLMVTECWGAIAIGWVHQIYIEPDFNFTFIGFEWLQPPDGYFMYYIFGAMGLLGLFVMLGWLYRFSIIGITLLWLSTYLMHKTGYNNHHYLILLLCLFMCILPAHQYKSLDVNRRPALKSFTCPRWCHVIFILQLFLVYTYASIAKMYPDWINGIPIGIWFSYKADLFLIGDFLQNEWLKWVVSYGGIAFDLLIVPALLWKRTRVLAFIVAIIFHLFNSAVFQIGVFPYLAIALLVFFFPAETIRKRFFRLKPKFREWNDDLKKQQRSNTILYALAIYFAFQVFLPLRHLLYDGNVFWNEEGHRLSWRMMLRVKVGSMYLLAVDHRTQERQKVYPIEHLTSGQVYRMATRPDMIWQFAQYVKKKFAAEGKDVALYAYSQVSLNGRDYYPLVDSSVDLTAVHWQRFQHAQWIMPLLE